uniref:EF-hand domain-containing protein n=1 Tax=Setaria digitata TaxID=48799 RepID=A0A915Q5R8_9BILA
MASERVALNISEMKESELYKEITSDNGNDDSFPMNLTKRSAKSDNFEVAAIQQNSSTFVLPPVSPQHNSMRISKCNLHDETLTSPRRLAKDFFWNYQHKTLHHISEAYENPASSDVLNYKSESSCILSLHLVWLLLIRLLISRLVHSLSARLSPEGQMFKWFEKFEREQENIWNCGRQIPSSSSCPDIFSARSIHHDMLVLQKADMAITAQKLDNDTLQNNLNSLMISTSETASNNGITNDSNDNDVSWRTASPFPSLEMCIHVPKISRKLWQHDGFDREQINILKCSRENESVDCDECPHFTLQRNQDESMLGRIERGRNENSFETLLPVDLDSSAFHEIDIVEETEPISFSIPRQVNLFHMAEICSASELCPLWKRPLYNSICTSNANYISFIEFSNWWEKFEKTAHDEASRFVYILTNGSRNFLTANDFESLIQDLIETLPSLSFLKEADTFHQAYEHFYVIYCNFHILDRGEKNQLTPFDLSLYSNGALTNLVMQRIFSGAVSSNYRGNRTMDYTAFVNFLLAEVDKCHPKSIEYWFRVMDLNGDGRISFDEMERFYNEVMESVNRVDMDVMTFRDLVNMLQDMISPKSPTYFTLSDLKRSPSLARYFFNTFINWLKHIAQESGLPDRKNEEGDLNDWSCFCKLQHEILAANVNDEDSEMADGTLAVDYVVKSTIRPALRVSTLGSLYHTSEHNIQNSPKEEQSKFIFEDNYLEDSWGLHSSMLIETFPPCSPRCISNITNSPNIPDQPSTFPLLSMDCEMYQLCWVSNSDLSSIDQVSFTEDFLPASLLSVTSNSAVEHISEISFSDSFFENEQADMLINPLALDYTANNMPAKT